jgi:hypothetical protein
LINFNKEERKKGEKKKKESRLKRRIQQGCQGFCKKYYRARWRFFAKFILTLKAVKGKLVCVAA